MLRNDAGLQADQIASERSDIFLLRHDTPGSEIRLKNLRAFSLHRVRFPTEDIRETRNLVNYLDFFVARRVELLKQLGDLLNRQPFNDLAEATFCSHGAEVLNRNEDGIVLKVH